MLDRREFLNSVFSSTLGVSAASLGLLNFVDAQAQSFTDYRALVCIYLFGGNDGYNTLIPYESAAHSEYLNNRPLYRNTGAGPAGLGLPRSSLLPLQNSNGNYALHPALTRLHARYQAGEVACLLNVGNLVEPLTATSYANPARIRPAALLSHNDQQEISMLALKDPFAQGSDHGWGARLIRQMFPDTDADSFLVSFSGRNRWQESTILKSMLLEPEKLLPVVMQDQLNPLIDSSKRSARPFTHVYGSAMSQAYQQGIKVNSVFENTSGVAYSAFNSLSSGATGGLFPQLSSVARFIEARTQLGVPGRQIFFVSMGGFDTHAAQFDLHRVLLNHLDSAIDAFAGTMSQLGLNNNVTTFTLSDFGRTLKMNASNGTDHAWASHYMVVGGAVAGGIYGRPANISPGSEDVLSFDPNVVIPSISTDQYAATLSSWMGLNASGLHAVFPNLRNFAQPNLGFMNS